MEEVRRLCAVLCTAVFTVACGTMEMERPPGGGAGGEVPPAPVRKDLYVTGVEYPEGYDWHVDQDYGYVACTVFLMKNGERIVEISVDPKDMVAPDADMHRCYDGHLYTDFSSDTETVIKCDGVELFRYPDREMICSMQVVGDDVYTLGMPRHGDGWTFRRNGMILNVKTTGYVLTRLGIDNGELWFAYVDQIVSGDDVRERYYLVRDGVTSPVGANGDVEKIDDILLRDGMLYYTARLKGMPQHIVYIGDQASSVELGSADETVGCRIHYDGGSVLYVTGIKRQAAIGDMSTLWKNFALDYNMPVSTTVYGNYIDGDDISYVFRGKYKGDDYRLIIWDKYSSVDYGEAELDYAMLGETCAAAYGGHLCVALHPVVQGTPPALIVDREMQVYDFNGYFTSVSYW